MANLLINPLPPSKSLDSALNSGMVYLHTGKLAGDVGEIREWQIVEVYLANEKFSPFLPDKKNWIPIYNQNVENPTFYAIEELHEIAKKSGQIFTQYNNGYYDIKDTLSIEWVTISWHWYSEWKEQLKCNSSDIIATIDQRVKWIRELVLDSLRQRLFIIGDMNFWKRSTIITAIAFDIDTILDNPDLYRKIQEWIELESEEMNQRRLKS